MIKVPWRPAAGIEGGRARMVNERQEMLGQSATIYFGPWYRQSPVFDATRRARLLRTLFPRMPVLRRDAARGLHRVRRLQPHAPARVLRRPRGRVLGP